MRMKCFCPPRQSCLPSGPFVEADPLMNIADYLAKIKSKFRKATVPYHVLEKIDLSKIAAKGKANLQSAAKNRPSSSTFGTWEKNFQAKQYAIYGNEIKRMGNRGTDKGSMAGAVDAKFNFIGHGSKVKISQSQHSMSSRSDMPT